MKIIKKLISFVLIVVIFMGGSLVNTQNVEAVSVGIYNSIESLPKNALDLFIDKLEKNDRIMLSRLGSGNVFGLMLIENNKYYFLSEKAFMSTYSYKADQKSFAKFTTALVDALNYNTGNADHSFYMLQRKYTYYDEYKVKLSKMSQEVWVKGKVHIVIKATIQDSLTFKYYSDIKQIKVTNRTNNGLKVKPKYMLKETKTSNGAYFNNFSAEVYGEEPKEDEIDVSKIYKVLYSTYSLGNSIISGKLVKATFQGAGLICQFCNGSDEENTVYRSGNVNLRKNRRYVYECESESPLYLKTKGDKFEITISASEELAVNHKMLTQFLLVPNYEESFS